VYPLADNVITIRRGNQTLSYRPFKTVRASNGQEVLADRLLVLFRPGVAEAQMGQVHAQAALRGAGAGRVVMRLGIAGKVARTHLVDVSGAASLEAAIRVYQGDPRVQAAEYDGIVRPAAAPNDPRYGNQWALTQIAAASAWDVTHGAAGIRIAILDTGIYAAGSACCGLPGHEDLNGKVVNQIDFTNSPCGPDDCGTVDLAGHGTDEAGIAGAATNNGLGIAGVGYDSTLLNVKVQGPGGGTDSMNINGINWASGTGGAKVINMSFGRQAACPQNIQAAIDGAWTNNIVLVAVAGNSNTNVNPSVNPYYPANCNHVLSVGATDSLDNRWVQDGSTGSNYGPGVQIAAPGAGILTTGNSLNPGSPYPTDSGTSMAAPHVSGLAALLWATNRFVNPDCVTNRIEDTADQIAGTGNLWQFGRINAANAVAPDFTDTFGARGNRPGPGVGCPWSENGQSGWTIANNQLQAPAGGSGLLTYNAGASNATGAVVPYSDGTVTGTLVSAYAPQTAYLVFRFQDGNHFWAWGKFSGVYKLGYWAAGTGWTYITANAPPLAPRDGDILRVVLNGQSITAQVDQGATTGQHTFVTWATATDTLFTTASQVGFGCGSGPCVFSNFSYNRSLAATGSPPPHPGVAFSDDFNRAGPAVGDGSHPWVAEATTWSLTNNQLQSITNADDDLIYWAGSGDGTITATAVSTYPPQKFRLVFRYQDSNHFWAWGKFNGVYKLGYWAAGSGWVFPAAPNLSQPGLAPQDGDVLRVVLNGPSITSQVGVRDAQGVVTFTTWAVANDATFQTATGDGVGCYGGTCLFDDFAYTPTLAATGAPPPPPGRTFSDSFARAGSVGDGQHPWIPQDSSWSLVNNQLQSVTGPDAYLVYPAGSGDGVVSVTLVNAATALTIRLLFRYQDGNNFWVFGTFGGVYRLARWGLGQGWVYFGAVGPAPQNGDHIVVTLRGTAITVQVNGTNQAAANDGAFVSATGHGMSCYGSTCLFSNFSYGP
jgi:thermitase